MKLIYTIAMLLYCGSLFAQKKLSQMPIDSVDANTYFVCINSTGGQFSDFRTPIAVLAAYLGGSSTLQQVLTRGDTTNLPFYQYNFGKRTALHFPYELRLQDTSAKYYVQMAQTPTGAAPQGAFQFFRNNKSASIYAPTLTHNNQDTVGDTSGVFAYTWQLPVIRTMRATTGSIPGGTSSLILMSWPSSFADNNYSATVSIEDATTSSLSLQIVHIEGKNLGQITVRVVNTSVGSLTGTIDAIGIHD